MPGPPIRTDIVEVYVFRRGASASAGTSGGVTFLQMRRVADIALPRTWQPVMGHMEAGETAAQTALRELHEETGFDAHATLGFWQLESPNTYFLHSHECIVMSPCFAVEVAAGSEPVLDHTHDAVRWVSRAAADRHFLWPGQRTAVQQIIRDILEPGSPAEPILRMRPEAQS